MRLLLDAKVPQLLLEAKYSKLTRTQWSSSQKAPWTMNANGTQYVLHVKSSGC